MKCEEGSWKKIKASRSGPGFSHIFFADDLLLFAKTDERNVEAVVEVLDVFCKLSGLKISKEKSIIFFSPNVSMEDKLDIVNLTEIGEIRFLGNYLGFPLIHKGRRCNEFHFVVERVQAKLNGWKSKCLSPAGRLCWRIASSLEMPWAQMLTCKYLTPLRLRGHSRNQTASRIWKACKGGGVIFNKGLRWSIANSESVSA